MSIGSAFLLGIVQGIAEFLPISSSGHLSVLQNLFGSAAPGEGHMFFDVLLHLGTLISICIMFWSDIIDMAREVLSYFGTMLLRAPANNRGAEKKPIYERNLAAGRLFFMIVMATIPLFFIVTLNDSIEKLYYKTTFIGVSFLLTGAMLFVADKMKPGIKTEKSMTVTDALIIGLCQAVATIPGLSRSGTTITAGIATGLERSFAVKFSFLMSLPAVLGANLIALIKAAKEGIVWANVPSYFVGMFTATIAGIFAISLMKYISKKSKFGYFAYYCIGAGVLTIVLSLVF
ncbi:MAG: undecaprenyl-diphosphate phosphatase [Ruminococcaceae bacterium]|nr:undecaprenyl-diphosphate phosphatase [Oscillospiraceae bacterium]